MKLKDIKIFKRWRAESPEFFKRITKFCIALGAVGITITMSPIALPAYAIAVAPHLIVAGTVGTAISKSTVKNVEDIQE